MTTAIKAKLCLSATAVALLCAACSGPGNTGQTPPDETLVKEMPWLNGGVPVLDETGSDPVIVSSALPVYPPIGQNLTDMGSLPIDCTVLAPYTFAPWAETGEPAQVNQAAFNFQPTAPGYNDPSTYAGLAIRWAGADDNTRGSWRTPGFATWYSGLVTTDGLLNSLVWGTPAQSVTDKGIVPDPQLPPVSSPFPPGPVPSCDGKTNAYVIHMRGANFRYYGGNIAHILAGDNFTATPGVFDEKDCPRNADNSLSNLCHPAPAAGATVDSAGFPLKPTKNAGSSGAYQLGALHTYLDLTAYDGVSFWARRGPDSMGTLQVTINDKYTSDDMNRQNETFCRRIYGCYTQCQNGEPCSQTDAETDANGAPLFRCFDPKKGKIPSPDPSNVSAASDLVDEAYPRCNGKDPVTQQPLTHGSACTFRDTYPDTDMEGKECRPYTFTSGESGEYCFNADDPPPPSREERCGDGFTSNLQLTGDWTFYTVPFSEMRQGGYGKIAPEFDLKSVYSITLAWGGGNTDIYLDNVSFYKTNN